MDLNLEFGSLNKKKSNSNSTDMCLFNRLSVPDDTGQRSRIGRLHTADCHGTFHLTDIRWKRSDVIF